MNDSISVTLKFRAHIVGRARIVAPLGVARKASVWTEGGSFESLDA